MASLLITCLYPVSRSHLFFTVLYVQLYPTVPQCVCKVELLMGYSSKACSLFWLPFLLLLLFSSLCDILVFFFLPTLIQPLGSFSVMCLWVFQAGYGMFGVYLRSDSWKWCYLSTACNYCVRVEAVIISLFCTFHWSIFLPWGDFLSPVCWDIWSGQDLCAAHWMPVCCLSVWVMSERSSEV